jgi:hypothetical protein
MIRYCIEANGEDVLDSYDEDKVTLSEASLIIFRMEELKQRLLSKDFKNKFKMEKKK